MIKPLLGLGIALWLVPILAFALTSLMLGKPHLGLAILALAISSSLTGWVTAKIVPHDAFEAFVSGTLIGMLLFAYPIGHYIIG